jgi:hypothetical protein
MSLMVRIIDLDNEYPLNGRDAIGWWKGAASQCEQFFKTISQFEPQRINAEYLIKLQMSYIHFERSPYPQNVVRARDILLNSMFATINATSAALVGDNEKLRQSLRTASASLQHLKKELYSLGIQIL